MRRIPIRAKLAASLAVPLVGLLVFSAIEVLQAAGDASQVRSETQLALAAGGPSGVVSSIQDERNWMSIELSGLAGQYPVRVEGYPETRAATDAAIQEFRDDIESKGGAAEATYREALDALDGLTALRNDIDGVTGPRVLANMTYASVFYDRYSELIHALLDANSRIALQVQDAELRQSAELISLANEQVEVMADVSRQTSVFALLSDNGIDLPNEISTVAMLLSDFETNNRQILDATGPAAAIVEEIYPREIRDLADGLQQNTEQAITTGRIPYLQAYLEGAVPTPGKGYWALRDTVTEVLSDRAGSLNAEASRHQLMYVIMAAAVLFLAAVVTWLVSQSITRPLRSLTRQAQTMADQRLPDAVRDILETPLGEDVEVPQVRPITVRTRDEVADVADALNTVQESALDLAIEQAVLRRNIADSFVNLGRRNQNLLGRQLDFITQLESNEADPDTLGSLFRLDHLATRMRRNAESLLVLAGIEPPRKWAAPVRISDVIRAALGEVEDYQRVRVEAVESVTILGSAAADLAHLLAELIENALTFSSPEDEVAVHGWWNDPAAYRVAIVDQGLGMSASAIDQANRRLARSESFTVAPSKYLGHYVAGNLAARHGIRIQLEQASASRGIVAAVDLPMHLLANEAGAEPALPPAHVAELPAPNAGPPPVPAGQLVAGPAVPELHVPGGVALSTSGADGPAIGDAATSWASEDAVPPWEPAARAAEAAPVQWADAPPMQDMPSPGGMPPAGRALPTGGGLIPGGGPLPGGPLPAPAGPALRTASGLPMRRSGASPATGRTQAAEPSGDLLAALAGHSHNLRGGARPSGPSPVAPAPSRPARGPGGWRDGTTTGGLPRRVSGAQLPQSQPLAIHHPGDHQPAPAPARDADASAADDVYSFLTGFTAGVQRGLDESRRDRPG